MEYVSRLGPRYSSSAVRLLDVVGIVGSVKVATGDGCVADGCAKVR